MRFLFKIAFWFSLVLLVIPLGRIEHEEPAGCARRYPPEPVGALDTFLAAREAITDVSQSANASRQFAKLAARR